MEGLEHTSAAPAPLHQPWLPPQAPFQAQLSLSKEISFPKLPTPEGFFHLTWGGLELLMRMCECADPPTHIPPTVGSSPHLCQGPNLGPARRHPRCSKEACHPDRPSWLSPSKVSLAQGGVWGTG